MLDATANPLTSGADLRNLRIAARVRPSTVARLLGVSRQRLSQVEAQDRVSAATAERYLAAIEAVDSVHGLLDEVRQVLAGPRIGGRPG